MLRFVLFALALLQATTVMAAAMPPTDTDAEEVPEHDDSEVAEARQEFDAIDVNKDGFITKEEILEMEEVPEVEEIDEFFSTYDANGDGRVTFEEIITADEELRKGDDEGSEESNQ